MNEHYCHIIPLPKPKGYWELDPMFKVYREFKPSLWKRFWVYVLFQIKWINEEK